MESAIIVVILTGILVGGIRVLVGADHLAAIAPFTAHRPPKGWVIGLWWGVGHTASVWLIGLLIFLLKVVWPHAGVKAW